MYFNVRSLLVIWMRTGNCIIIGLGELKRGNLDDRIVLIAFMFHGCKLI